jgi:hypothetical protein
MKKSLYSQAKYSGLSVRGGRLVNNRPDGQTGISQAIEVKKAMKKAEKIATMSEAFMIGEAISDMNEGGCGR